MKGAKFVIQDKFDGERILIHKKGEEVKFFTRNSIDYTLRYNYGSKFTPTVMRCVKAEK
jgi:DNA ligase-4